MLSKKDGTTYTDNSHLIIKRLFCCNGEQDSKSNHQNFLINSPVPLPNARPRLTEQRGITINKISPHAETGK
ncbi:hypothetical protein P3L10_012030 [Capsicum annuum]